MLRGVVRAEELRDSTDAVPVILNDFQDEHIHRLNGAGEWEDATDCMTGLVARCGDRYHRHAEIVIVEKRVRDAEGRRVVVCFFLRHFRRKTCCFCFWCRSPFRACARGMFALFLCMCALFCVMPACGDRFRKKHARENGTSNGMTGEDDDHLVQGSLPCPRGVRCRTNLTGVRTSHPSRSNIKATPTTPTAFPALCASTQACKTPRYLEHAKHTYRVGLSLSAFAPCVFPLAYSQHEHATKQVWPTPCGRRA